MKINHLEYVAFPEYSLIFNHTLSKEKLIKLLSGISCEKAIAILSRFASLHIGVCQQNQDACQLDWSLRVAHSNHIQKMGGNWIAYNQFKTIMCLQAIFELEKWALLYCPVKKKLSPILLPDLLLIMDAILAINDRLPKGEVSGHETEYLYLTLYHNTHKNIKDQIARAYYVFSTLAKRNPKMAVFLTCYEQMRGFSLEDRLTVLFDSLTNVISRFTITDMFTKGLCVTVEDFDAKGLAPVYEKILKTIRIDYTIAKKNASKTIDQVWNFEPFYRFPFVQIEALQFAFSETTIVYQMWEGLYWDVRYTFKTDGEKFMTLFGQPFEQYVREIAKASADSSEGNVKFQDEFLYKYKGQHRASTDCYFRISNTLVAIEAKAKSPHSSTLTGPNRAAIDVEVTELMFYPTKQVCKRLKEIYSKDSDIAESKSGFFDGIERTIILAVCMEKVQPIGELLLEFDKMIAPDISETNIVAYHSINIEEFEVICNLIELCPAELPKIFAEWFADQRKDVRSAVALANYLSSRQKPYSCSQYVSQLFNESLREISTKTFRKDLTSEQDHC